MIITTVKPRIDSTFTATFKVSKSDFQKGLKEIKGNEGARFDSNTKTWTVEISNTNRILKGNEEWYGLELVSVNGINVGQQPEVAATNSNVRDIRRMTTAQLYRDMDRADSDF